MMTTRPFRAHSCAATPSRAALDIARALFPAVAAVTIAASPALDAAAEAPATRSAPAAARPALSVEAVSAQSAMLALSIPANGSIAAWQEAVIGAEVSGLRLTEVRVNVGDVVRAGTLLAQFAAETVQAEIALQKATLAEAEAALAEAVANAQRAREVQGTGAVSAQQIGQLLTAETTGRARVEAARAQLQAQELRLRHTRVLAPDDGTISVRLATVGSVAQPGQELFRLIRQGRIEWRAEVPAALVHRVRPGQRVRVSAPSGEQVEGRVRVVAPTVEVATRNALVYVDVRTTGGALRPGMFARGEIDLGTTAAITLPQSAILLRDGFAWVFRIGPDAKVAQTKVSLGRREADRVEVLDGLPPDARVVRSGVAFLADGDTVKVVERAPAAR